MHFVTADLYFKNKIFKHSDFISFIILFSDYFQILYSYFLIVTIYFYNFSTLNFLIFKIINLYFSSQNIYTCIFFIVRITKQNTFFKINFFHSDKDFFAENYIQIRLFVIKYICKKNTNILSRIATKGVRL